MSQALPLTYTVIGVGGMSPALPGLNSATFWWIDTTGTAPASEVAARGFTPFPAFVKVVDTLGAGGGGSLLMSSPFTLHDGQLLEVTFELLKVLSSYANNDTTAPLGFALLRPMSGAVTVLANITAEDRNYFNNSAFLTSVGSAETQFTSPSSGVNVVAVSGSGLDITLNGAHYAADPNLAGMCGCFLKVTSTLQATAGTYQLLFGIYDFRTEGTAAAPDLFRGALTVNQVTSAENVPSPPQNVRISDGQ